MIDLLVAGAGIAGLHVATEYLTHKGSSASPKGSSASPKGSSASLVPSAHTSHPSHSSLPSGLLLVERNTYLGGKIYTHRPYIPGKGIYQWEAGAGRIPTTHKRIIHLIKEYGLTFQHWSAPSNLVDKFPDLIPTYLEPLLALPAPVLAQHTLADLLKQIHGSSATDFIKLFPYWAEFHTLRADVALDAFLKGPLGAGTDKAGQGPASRSTAGAGWGGCAEGLSALTEKMGEDIKARGGEIRLGTSVLAISPLGGAQGMAVLLESDGKQQWITAKKVVLALDVTSLRHVKGVSQLPVLKYLKQEPLLRTYAVFPVKGGRSWFSGMAKEVVPGPIRFFIPMDATKGLAMISYTEGRDARHWMDIKSVKDREKAVMKALRELYQDKEIPDPVMIKFHGWNTGCTYWLPARGASATDKEHWVSRPKAGEYDVEEESDNSVQPDPTQPLYLCSESFAVQQSWMESALVQAEKALAKLLR